MAKYVRLSFSFLIASLAQGAVVALGEGTGFSTFQIAFSTQRILGHVLVGQVGGYILWYLFCHMKAISGRKRGTLFGLMFGVVMWGAILTVGTLNGVILLQWLGFTGILTTLAAFLVYGAVIGYAAWRETPQAGAAAKNLEKGQPI